ncbi:unnamed protein product [Discosporangium mesarthrocarpum]
MSSSSIRSFVVIVAATASSMGIGRNGTLPWRLAADMAYFKRVTSTAAPGKTNAVIMGRKTWESISHKFRPLSGRRNIILSRNPRARDVLGLPDNVLLARSLDEALEMLAEGSHHGSDIDQIFVIGGGAVYREAVSSNLCDKVLITSIHSDKFNDCDTFFPPLSPSIFRLVKSGEPKEEGGIKFSFDEYKRFGKQSTGPGPEVSVADTSVPALPTPTQSEAMDGDTAGQEENAVAGPGASRARGRLGSMNPITQALAASNAGNNQASTSLAAGEEVDKGERNEEEMQYLRLVEEILESGIKRGDRTGTGTLSKFGVQMRYSLRGGRFPLLTTKRLFWRGVAEELLWFISGCTNANVLKERGIHIWDGNGSREFLDNLGFTDREEGDLGPVYGFQWRHFGAVYVDMHTDYTGKGVDQLAECINKIK